MAPVWRWSFAGGNVAVMRRRLRSVALLAFVAAVSCRPSEAPRPNILFILVDDLRWDDIAVAGHSFVETPNIDRLAREGTRFLNAFAATPLC